MAPLERAQRMRRLRDVVARGTASSWADHFVAALAEGHRAGAPDPSPLDNAVLALAALPGVEVHVVSGRPRATLDRWLGGLPLWLHAEHAAWTRAWDGPWSSTLSDRPAWHAPVRALMQEAHARLPGSLVEEKSFGLTFHWRTAKAPPSSVELVVAELRARLLELATSTSGLDVRDGDHIVEARPRGVHKGLVVDALKKRGRAAPILAAGNDLTDEDLFAALPAGAVSVQVGPPRRTAAAHHTSSPETLRALLQRLVDARRRGV
jgi:trehalose 6-phosphate synthase/phosphatase